MESHVEANNSRVKMGSKTKTYHVNMLKKYISREPEGNVVPVDSTDDRPGRQPRAGRGA